MPLPPTTPPKWAALSHHARYRRLHKVRRVWCRRYRRNEDRSGLIVHLDGTWIDDVPSFYLSLGEAINGPSGYFGASLDALDDCLNGHFGVKAPLTVYLSHYEKVREALDARAWCRWRAESFRECVGYESTGQLTDWGYFGDGSEEEIARWTAVYEAVLAGEPCDCEEFGSYFDTILSVFEGRGSALLPAPEDTTE